MENIIYEIIETPMGTSIVKAILADGSILCIPMHEANSDYQAYLEHEAAAK
jgi:hypothetical protein